MLFNSSKQTIVAQKNMKSQALPWWVYIDTKKILKNQENRKVSLPTFLTYNHIMTVVSSL